MNIAIDLAVCEGHGLCEQVAPSVYRLDDEGYVSLAIEPIPERLEGEAAAGARVCPVAALTVRP
ncbi:ferredoxin [Herbiconiux liukaitaii]|uniref:ferredoxin n=1 Tax=Herbiconiux liukaitaii TaxID=3342799 RepID=UPI0035BA6482